MFSTFSSIFITRRPGGVRYRRKDFKGNALHWDRRFGYDIRKCPIYRGRYMRGFLLELSLDGTGTWVSVRYKRLSGLSEDVIREFYCILKGANSITIVIIPNIYFIKGYSRQKQQQQQHNNNNNNNIVVIIISS